MLYRFWSSIFHGKYGNQYAQAACSTQFLTWPALVFMNQFPHRIPHGQIYEIIFPMIFPLIFPLYHYNITIIVQLYSQIPSWIKLTRCQFGLIVAVGLSSLEASHEAVDCLRSFLNLVQTRLRLRLLSNSDPRVGWVEQKNRCGPWQFDNLNKLEVRGAEDRPRIPVWWPGQQSFCPPKTSNSISALSLDGPEAADRRDAVQADLCQVVRRALSAMRSVEDWASVKLKKDHGATWWCTDSMLALELFSHVFSRRYQGYRKHSQESQCSLF